MSERAISYVRELGRDQVTSIQKTVLLAIAHEHTERHKSANLSLEDLSDEVFRSRRQLTRIFRSVEHILEYKPGIGKGNYSQFRFLELDGKVAERRHKGDISDAAIRKENLNQVPDQNQPPPTPLSSKVGSADPKPPRLNKLATVRQIREFRDRVIRLAGKRTDLSDIEVIERACMQMLFPLDVAAELITASGDQETGQALRALIEARKDAIPPALKKRSRSAARDQGILDGHRRLSPDPPAPPQCIVGKCGGCGRPRLQSSTWSDYCADSCRDAHRAAIA